MIDPIIQKVREIGDIWIKEIPENLYDLHFKVCNSQLLSLDVIFDSKLWNKYIQNKFYINQYENFSISSNLNKTYLFLTLEEALGSDQFNALFGDFDTYSTTQSKATLFQIEDHRSYFDIPGFLQKKKDWK